MRSRFREVVFALVPLAVVLLVAGIAGEWWLRARHADERAAIAAKAKGREPCTQASADPLRIYEGVPGKCGQNSLGFRDREHAVAKPAGTFRIAIVGDSVAHGQGVAPDEALGRVLERELAARGKPVEVMVFATTGYSTGQERALLDIAYRFGPDLVLWTYVFNDPADPLLDNANGELGVYWHSPRSYVLDYLGQLWSRARINAAGGACPAEWHRRMHCLYRERIAADFAAIAASSKAHGVPLAVVLLPLVPAAGFAPYPFADLHRDVQALATAHGLTVIDALPAFDGVKVEEVRVADSQGHVDPWHPNARGHELLGTYLARALTPKLSATR